MCARAHQEQNSRDTESRSLRRKVRKWEAGWRGERKASKWSQTDSFPGARQKTRFHLPFPVLGVHNSSVFKKMRHPKQEANNGFIGNCLFIVEERARTLSVPAAALRRTPMVNSRCWRRNYRSRRYRRYSTVLHITMSNLNVTGLEGISFLDQ